MPPTVHVNKGREAQVKVHTPHTVVQYVMHARDMSVTYCPQRCQIQE
jgi:hypothetical protein